MAGKTRPGPESPLTSVESKVVLTNAVLSLSMNDDLAPRVALLARALYRGLSGQGADRHKDEPRFIYEPAYVLGRLLHDYLPEEEEDPAPCPPVSRRRPGPVSSPQGKRPVSRVRRTASSTTGSTPSV